MAWQVLWATVAQAFSDKDHSGRMRRMNAIWTRLTQRTN